jgi:hypothetical protein
MVIGEKLKKPGLILMELGNSFSKPLKNTINI